MTSDKTSVALLKELFTKKGLTDIVISPGSRNAPVIIAFAGGRGVRAYSVTDERSAAFFALGMAVETGKAVAVASTSGSAPLNYAPAVAEAFYQKIPLLVITADRPSHMVDIGDGQTIRQKNIYWGFIKKSYNIPENLDKKEDFAKAEKMINEAIDLAHFPDAGPVHINLPFDEPLYGKSEKAPHTTVIDTRKPVARPPEQDFDRFVRTWNKSRKIMILAGQQQPDEQLSRVLTQLAQMPQVTVLTETTSNLRHELFIDTIDNLLTAIKGDEKSFAPELLITFGDAVVSKMIKKYLRKYPPGTHWHISPSGEKRDTYFALTGVFSMPAGDFFNKMLYRLKTVNSGYASLWADRRKKALSVRNSYLETVPWSDFFVYKCLFEGIPKESNLHLGNSTPVRYSQLFGTLPGFKYYSNRGVSGIDGQISTAAGVAMFSDKINTVITGDLGFFYDSNAMMNKYLKSNLKVIVINNGGGGIFRFIPGPDTTPFLEEFFTASHNWNAEGIAAAFNAHYFRASNKWELKAQLPVLYRKNNRPGILEVITPAEESAEVLKNYFKAIEQAFNK